MLSKISKGLVRGAKPNQVSALHYFKVAQPSM